MLGVGGDLNQNCKKLTALCGTFLKGNAKS